MTADNRRAVTGAALHRTIEKQLRADLAAYGLDMSRYACTVESGGDQPAAATFTDGAHTISVNPIWTYDDGTIIQNGRPELA